MANKTIPNLPDYGSQDTDKIKKDLLEITKNDGTYASPSYPTGASRKITLEEFKTALDIETSLIKDIVFKYDVDTVLEVGKINWINSTLDRSLTIPTANVGNLGKILIVNNRSIYTVTIYGSTGNLEVLKGVDSIAGFVCVTDGSGYGWETFTYYNKGDFDLVSQTITNGVTNKAPSEDAVFDAFALKEDLITKNALSTPLVWTSANGVASFQPLPVLGDLTYYLTNSASDVATYYKQTTTPQVALTSLPFASVTNGQLLATFISDPSNPNRLSIPDGQYLNHLHLGKTGGTKDLQVRAEIWETTSSGVDIVKLADLGPSTIITGSGSTEYIIGYNTVEKTLSAVTSRIATKVYAVVSGGGSAPSISIFQGDGSDSRSNLPAPVVDATNYVPYTGALNDIDLGSKNITTTDVIVSGATALTIAHFDATKNIESLPLATYPSLTELSYVKGVTSAIQAQIDAKGSTYLLTNYVKIDLQNGVNATALINRVDKPFLTLQAAYDAVILAGGTNAYYFDIVGDATFTANMLTMTSTRGLFTFNFSGKITSSIVNSGATKGLISYGGFTINSNKYIFNSDFIQTTNVGMGIGSGSNQQFIFNGNTTLKNPKGIQDNYGFYALGNYNSFYAKNLTWDITNDTGVTPYIDVFQIGTYPNIHIETLQVIGTSTAVYTPTFTYGANISNLIIENQVWSCAYTTIAGISLTENGTTIDNCELRNVSIASNSGLKATTFNLLRANSINTLKIGNASLLAGFFDIWCDTINDCYLGNILTTGIISGDEKPFISGTIRVGKVTRTLSSTRPIFTFRGGAKLIGGIISVNNTLDATYAPIKLYYTPSTTKYIEINDVSFQNIGIPATSSEGAPFIRGYGTLTDPCYLLLKGCTFSGTAGNSNANTTVFKNEGDVSNNTFIIEGDFSTNYFGTVPTGVTVNADVKLITNLQI